MPKRTDIKRIMLIGSGPIIIGQACEFDYSGAQACKALREEGYEVILVNSNPATIMTDPDFADRTYIEPLSLDVVTSIIERERPDALLPTLGGQTALNLAIDLDAKGVLKDNGVELLAASPDVIEKAENRQLFKDAMQTIGLETPLSTTAHSMEEAYAILEKFNTFPLIIRPAFTLGGTGGGIAYDKDGFETICRSGLFYSPTNEILIEESILGWKEYELEVMRDRKDNCVVVCSIENFDPMGVHTGDSITIAPAQTLTDREYQVMRDKALAVMREIGVETGGSNVQFAVNPDDGRLVVIEMNPRVSRSSALASKATGFPIAKIAAKLAVGYTLDELMNDITSETPSCFEPTLDYVVTKIPRFAFEKFAASEDSLGTQMKSVGEVMSIGKSFKESFQKALRSLESGRFGFGADGKDAPFEELTDEVLAQKLQKPNSSRIFQLRSAFRRGWCVDKVHDLTWIDPWFLSQLAELAAYEDEIASAGSLEVLRQDVPLFRQAKEMGYSDRQIAYILNEDEAAIREARFQLGIVPVYGLVDTCAAEFRAYTPYYYATYGQLNEAEKTDKKKVMILGSGPNRIGQGIEFDYCCVQAAYALHDAGFESVMVNCNPETVSTDYDTSDKLYFEPLTLEDILHIYRQEECWGAIVQFGGQTPLNLALDLQANGVRIIGTQPEQIEAAEDRDFFQKMANRLGLKQPENGLARSFEEARTIAGEIGYPVLLRPSFVLGGRSMVIVYDEEGLQEYMQKAVDVSEQRPVLIDRYLEDALEVDVDCISDGKTHVIGAIMEHIEYAGVHSGDSACVIPAITLSDHVKEEIKRHTYDISKELNVCGLMNVQYAIKDEQVYILEVNPRASRTVPFVSKSIGASLARVASLVMAGRTLEEIGFTEQIIPQAYSIKEAVFPFVRFPGTDVILTPEMKSTGEVMGTDIDPDLAFYKSQVAAGNALPKSGNVFLSVRNQDKDSIIPYARKLQEMGFTIFATDGTSTALRDNGIPSKALFKLSQGRPNIIDLIEEGSIHWIINTPSDGAAPRKDEVRIRSHTVLRGIPITTTMDGFSAAVKSIEKCREVQTLDVCSLQEYHENAPQLKLN